MSEKWVALRETRLETLADLSRTSTETVDEKTIDNIIEDFSSSIQKVLEQENTITNQQQVIESLTTELNIFKNIPNANGVGF